MLDRGARAREPIAAVRELAGSMCAPPTGWTRRRGRRARGSTCARTRPRRAPRRARGLGARWASTSPARRSSPPSSGPPSAAPQRRARPRRTSSTSCARARGAFEIVFVLGLEQGGLPRRALSFAVPRRRRGRLDQRARREAGPPRSGCARALPLLHRVHAREPPRCTSSARPRPTTALRARPARSGTRCARSGRRTRWSAGRRGAALVPDLAARARPHRTRAVAVSRRPVACGPAKLPTLPRARTGGSGGSARACVAFDRPTRLRHPAVLEELRAKTTFGVTELEAFADCSSIWFIERIVSPRSIDNQPDARLRGSIAHSALHKFFAGCRRRSGRTASSRSSWRTRSRSSTVPGRGARKRPVAGAHGR